MLRKNSAILKSLTALVLLHLFVAITLAASPALHRLVHHDSGAQDHDCAVTMLANGQVDHSTPVVACPAPQGIDFVTYLPGAVENTVTASLAGSRLGRAPPVVG